MELVYGAGKLDRRVPAVDVLLRDWREKEKDYGQVYLEFVPVTPRDRVLVEDLAATMLINSRVAAPAATSVYRNGAAVDLRSLPDKSLEETIDEERQLVADVIGTMTSWPWVGASLATKTLHKKRPTLIPILDNQAIFGAYMNPVWPGKPSLTETVKAVQRIKEALDWIAYDLTRAENETVWPQLQAIEPERTPIELFDCVWWMYFRQVEPVAPAASAAKASQVAASATPAPSTTQNEDVLIFRADDAAYLRWISEHPGGYVVNAERNLRPSYLKLHRATCTWLSGRGEPGAYTERQYIKICSTSLDALGHWARQNVGSTPESRCACM